MSVRISVASFLDYVRSTPRGCVSIVKEQRSMYLDPTNQGSAFYGRFRSAMRRAVSSPDADAVLGETVRTASRAQQPHFEALRSGFSRWWRRTQAHGVPVSSGMWINGDLRVTIANRSCFGLRYGTGATEMVLPYVKEPELGGDAAYLALRILELNMDELIPGATPMVLDVRRGKPLRLRKNTNRSDLDALLAAESAKYLTHWQAAAA